MHTFGMNKCHLWNLSNTKYSKISAIIWQRLIVMSEFFFFKQLPWNKNTPNCIFRKTFYFAHVLRMQVRCKPWCNPSVALLAKFHRCIFFNAILSIFNSIIMPKPRFVKVPAVPQHHSLFQSLSANLLPDVACCMSWQVWRFIIHIVVHSFNQASL